MNANNRLLLLVQTHAHAAALMDCIPHIRANYEWVWVVYSPAVLADPAVVEKEFDQQIGDLSKAARDCYAREDGAGGDAYKAKRDAAILEKSAKVKDAWKALAKDAQDAAVNRLFKPFYDARPCANVAITQGPDHFETVAHVEFQNSLKAGMKPGFVAGEYVVAWPTSLPKEGSFSEHFKEAAKIVTEEKRSAIAEQAIAAATTALGGGTHPQNMGETITPIAKIDKRKKENRKAIDPRLRELMQMSLDDLGPIAFELGIKPGDPIAGKRMTLVHRVHELEKERAEREIAQM